MSDIKNLIVENQELKKQNAKLKEELHIKNDECSSLWSQNIIDQYESTDEYLEAKGDN
tara:strand:+ start:28 stop:201 length:174 start_codon:yes stop_codon:yes gene_type:complete